MKRAALALAAAVVGLGALTATTAAGTAVADSTWGDSAPVIQQADSTWGFLAVPPSPPASTLNDSTWG